jgi:CheY-like chemotaxis protein/HPt (histidine-containing phosphotransfer) domain-containing protein
MNAIIGMSHLIGETKLTEKQHDYVKKIDSSAKSLLRIINEILDFSKIEAGKLTIEAIHFYLEDVLANVLNNLSVMADEKGLELKCSLSQNVPINLIGDPLRLSQILINLTNNAIKFTKTGKIEILVETKEQQEDTVSLLFSVIDTGIGISQEQVDILFNAFSQADASTTRIYGGTGLGLAISKQLSNLMGGDISVKSAPGIGSTFSLTVPFHLQPLSDQNLFLPPKELLGLKILIVDNDESMRHLLQKILRSFSFETTMVSSGEEALEAINKADKNSAYQLVLMDWNMQGIDGIKASKRILQLPNVTEKPIIILVTGYGQENLIQQSKDAGLDGIIFKPILRSELFNAILAAFKNRHINDPFLLYQNNTSSNTLQNISGAHVLIVEDNELNRQVVQELLDQTGIILSFACNGKEGLQMVLENDFDLVLMDIQMPEMDGLEACRKIRASGQKKLTELPIVAMTAHAMSGDKEKSLSAGMNDHLTKPIDPKMLLSIVTKWIKPRDRTILPALAQQFLKNGPPDEEPKLPSLPGIDMKDGLARMNGNIARYITLLQKFSANQKTVGQEIKEALNLGNIEIAGHLLHTLKGVSGNIGARELFTAVLSLEQTLKDGKMDEILTKCTRMEKKLNNVLLSIASLKKKSAEDTPTDHKTTGVLKPLLHKLAVFLRENNTEARQCLEEILSNCNTGMQQTKFRKIEKLVNAYDFDSALVQLNLLTSTMDIYSEEGKK